MERDPDEKVPPRLRGDLVEAATATGEGERLAAHRVLVIDDEPTIRVALRRFFSRMGWEVAEAADGNAALAILIGSDSSADTSKSRFDMVLSDIRMPGLNGMQLYDRLKTARPEILRRLVFSTGDVHGSETSDFVRDAGCLVVQKPFMLSELKEIAERLAAS
ncbi:MAG: response regulator [Gemmatimonadaceae bacterium]